MRACLFLAAALSFVASTTLAAPKTKFPYTTQVTSDQAEVRSGPGNEFYATQRLKRGQTVIVHRHDPGGWQMIAPPTGSYSWIPASAVRRTAPKSGVITAPTVDIRVGGRSPEQRDVFQSRLAEGDEVQILDEQILDDENGGNSTSKWYRINPPAGEWRWIPAQALAPPSSPNRKRDILPAGGFADDEEATTGDVNSPDRVGFHGNTTSDSSSESSKVPMTFASDRVSDDATHISQEANRPYAEQERDEIRKPEPKAAPPRRPAAVSSSPGNNGTDEQYTSYLAELESIDSRLKQMAATEPLTWNLDQIEHDYQSLKEVVPFDDLVPLIDQRLNRLGGMRQTQARRHEVRRIMLETERRDAQLVEARRLGIPPNSIFTFQSADRPVDGARLPVTSRPQTSDRPSPVVSQRDGFDGAGIVQRSQRRGVPAYQIVSPEGRFLAYLTTTTGVDIGSFEGLEAGVVGRRGFDRRLGADVIVVNRLAPVRLARSSERRFR